VQFVSKNPRFIRFQSLAKKHIGIQFLASLLRSERASESSPQFQLRVNATKKPSLAGAEDFAFAKLERIV
jgi:hypothetical protein